MNKTKVLRKLTDAIGKLPISDIEKSDALAALDGKTKAELETMLKNMLDIETDIPDKEETSEEEPEETPKKTKPKQDNYNERQVLQCVQCGFHTREKITKCSRCDILLIKYP